MMVVPSTTTPTAPADAEVNEEPVIGVGVSVNPSNIRGAAVVGGSKGKLELPITRMPDGDRDTAVPAIVTALPPGVIAAPPTWKPDGFAAKTSLPALKTLNGFDVGPGTARLTLELPIARIPEGDKDIGVPDMVIVAELGRMVESPTRKPVGLAVNV